MNEQPISSFEETSSILYVISRCTLLGANPVQFPL